jgi:hypothetical protein
MPVQQVNATGDKKEDVFMNQKESQSVTFTTIQPCCGPRADLTLQGGST